MPRAAVLRQRLPHPPDPTTNALLRTFPDRSGEPLQLVSEVSRVAGCSQRVMRQGRLTDQGRIACRGSHRAIRAFQEPGSVRTGESCPSDAHRRLTLDVRGLISHGPQTTPARWNPEVAPISETRVS